MKTFYLLLCGVLGTAVSADHFFVKKDGHTCIIMDANITGSINYHSKQKVVNYPFTINQPLFNGSCGTESLKEQSLQIRFYPNVNATQNLWELSFLFAFEKDQKFIVKDYFLKAAFHDETSKGNETLYVKNGKGADGITAAKANAYSCTSYDLGLSMDSVLTLRELKLIAFANLDKSEFPESQVYEQCVMDQRTSQIIPMVVGAGLALLVIIVLIAYLIGRARAKRQGYASV